jgi:DNA polymerase II large subunit
MPFDKPRIQRIPISDLVKNAVLNLGEHRIPKIKGVTGLVSKTKTPEPIEKGILRAKHGIYAYKDGTSRYDMTNVPLTHFKPREIKTSIKRLMTLGYTHDYNNNSIESDDQIIELKPQDVIVSKSCGEYLLKVSKFIDDLLVKFYGSKPFYKTEKIQDLVGHLIVGISPHTSGAILGRIIGFTNANVMYAHPYFHSAKRRNADGDEDSVILLLDVLINFSKSYLPESRGGMMDAPLVLTVKINPDEIDREVHNMDVCSEYPLELYESAQRYAHPKEIESLIDIVHKRLGSVSQYEGFKFTHDTSDIEIGPTKCIYKKLDMMSAKIDMQLQLHSKLRSVDASDAAGRLITTHFLPDIIGNLRKFSTQQFRCTKCNKTYRRIPLRGVCVCGNNLTLTVHEKSVLKYLQTALKISEDYHIDDYIKQHIRIMEYAVKSTFNNRKTKPIEEYC